jgi:hypothetical protein
MSGYANRFLRKEFPDLGEGVFIEIRNPKVQAPSGLRSDNSDELEATYEISAKLIKDWLAYDATSDADDQPILPSPATAESVSKLPFAILSWISEQINAAVTPR